MTIGKPWLATSSATGRRILLVPMLLLGLQACDRDEISELIDQQSVGETGTYTTEATETSGYAPASIPKSVASEKTISTLGTEPQIGDVDYEAILIDEEGPKAGDKLAIDDIQVKDITAYAARVHWSATAPVTGQVFFGTTGDLGRSTVKEDSFRWSAHIQPLNGLQPDTEYFLQAESSDELGNTVVSDIVRFRTLKAPSSGGSSGPVPDGWPANADQNLPMAGIFYGNHQAGGRTGNSRIALQHSRRFRAVKSGHVVAHRHHNRVLVDANITGRCKVGRVSAWCTCERNGLDRYTCGYTLGGSYSVGNGGSQIIEIREDDGTAAHRPGKLLGKIGQPFVPMNEPHYPVKRFSAPIFLQAGKLYHLVYRNLNPPSGCALSGVSPSRARSCPRNAGAISLNGVWYAAYGGNTAKRGPFRGDSAAILHRNADGEAWKEDGDNLSWFELEYEDGQWVGDFYAAYNAIYSDARRVIKGGTVARQVFTVEDRSRDVNGLWLNYGHDAPSRPDGSPLSVTLKDAGGRVLATGKLPASRSCMSIAAKGGGVGNTECRTWEYTDLSNAVTLIEGSRYTVEFRASSQGGYALSTFFPLNYNPARAQERTFWDNAQAEISKDGGRSWSLWHGNYYPQRDLGLVFTIVGMPKQLK